MTQVEDIQHTTPDNTQPNTPPNQLDAPNGRSRGRREPKDAWNPDDTHDGHDEQEPSRDDRHVQQVVVEFRKLRIHRKEKVPTTASVRMI